VAEMSVRPAINKKTAEQYKDKRGLGWVIDYYPASEKGKRQRFYFYGKEGAANYLFLQLRIQSNRPPAYPKVLDLLPFWLEYYKNNKSVRTHEDAVSSLRVLVPFFREYGPTMSPRRSSRPTNQNA